MVNRLGPLAFARGLVRLLHGKPQVPPGLKDNALLDVVLHRRSVRTFTDDPIPDDVFAAILEAGRVAPSTVNLQTWTFFGFDPERWRERFGQRLPFGGQRAIVVLADMHRHRTVLDAVPASPLVEYTIAIMNASLAAMNMTVAAQALGLGSVMLSETGRAGLLDAGFLRETFALPDGVVPLTTIVFGYPRGLRPAMPPRLPLDAIYADGRSSSYREPDPVTMQAWLEQMIAGYDASHPGSSFAAQLKVYADKIGRAEADLRTIAGL